MERKMTFDTQKSISNIVKGQSNDAYWSIKIDSKEYTWDNNLERIALIRKGLPYTSIEYVSKNADLPVKTVLHLLGVPQTTYNKRKREKHLLDGRNSELVLVLTELITYGIKVFNGEKEKFHRWMKKPNIALGGVIPNSLFDSLTGIQIVKEELDRIEYGIFA